QSNNTHPNRFSNQLPKPTKIAAAGRTATGSIKARPRFCSFFIILFPSNVSILGEYANTKVKHLMYLKSCAIFLYEAQYILILLQAIETHAHFANGRSCFAHKHMLF